jgi:Flp pilus assembly protein TadG
MKRRSFPTRFASDARGAVAIEYAITLPVLLLMLLGAIWTGLLIFSMSSMEMAVETAARCASVDSSNCGSPYATENFARSQYAGPAISPVFTASSTGCGHTVTGQATFNLALVPGFATVPLSASACYP